MRTDDTSTIAEPPPVPASTHGECGNCGRSLLGPYCYHCGQPVQGLVRHFSSIAGDFLDTVLNWDARLPRTLWPLFAKPAFLTREYFAGRRVRYVSPVRMFVTLSIVTFFVAQLMVSFGGDPVTLGVGGRDTAFDKATTIEEVIRQRDVALKEIADARNQKNGAVPGLDAGLRAAETAVRRRADQRIEALRAKDRDPADAADAATDTDAARAHPVSHPGGDATRGGGAQREKDAPADFAGDDHPGNDRSDEEDFDALLSFPVDGKPWDAKANPVVFAALPRFANDGLNRLIGRAKTNIASMRKNPDQFKDAVLGAVPSTLFVLLPVFALMLKLLYVFKRRLYMEHLIVALHSHAFLCLSLLLMFGAMALRDASGGGFWHGVLGWIEAALWVWMPLSLLLMQKRVYAQGWPMTLLKYSVLGWCYVFLLSFGAVFTVMFSVVWG